MCRRSTNSAAAIITTIRAPGKNILTNVQLSGEKKKKKYRPACGYIRKNIILYVYFVFFFILP